MKLVKYILILLIVSRILISILGTLSIEVLGKYHPRNPDWNYTQISWLKVWGIWDTGWYLDIAKNGYSANISLDTDTHLEANYNFFPLYPTLVKIVGVIIPNLFISGLIVSNLSLIIACIYLYKIVRLRENHLTALRSIKYLIFFPTSFLLSGFFSESLFLALALTSFYFTMKKKWVLASIMGFLLSLTRSVGVLIIIPVLYEYLKEKQFNLRQIAKPSSLVFLLIPLGLLLYVAYIYSLTGDLLALVKMQAVFGRHMGFFAVKLIEGLTGNNINYLFWSYFTLITIVMVGLFYKKLDTTSLLLSLLWILFPLSSGVVSMPRYIMVVFPIYILLAKLTNKETETIIIALMALIQGFLIVFWSNGFELVV